MRERLVLPDNFACSQQAALFNYLDSLYETGPKIGLVTAPPGFGKSHGFRQYKETVADRHRKCVERRRTIAFADVYARFKAEGLLQTKDDEQWLNGAWSSMRLREHASEDEVRVMVDYRREHPLWDLDEATRPDPVGRPSPSVALIAPSQTTTENDMIRLFAYHVLGNRFPARGIFGTFHPRQMLFEELGRGRGSWIIIVDEAQRLRPAVLNLCREVYDDAGVTLVIAGTPDIMDVLVKRSCVSLFNRIHQRHEMLPINHEQLQKLLPAWEAKLVRRVLAYTDGVFRRIGNLVELAEELRIINDEPQMSLELLDEAARHIPDIQNPDLRLDLLASRGKIKTKPPREIQSVAEPAKESRQRRATA